jgi:hypothetical protein
MELIDYKTQLKKFYKPASAGAEWVDVPAMNFIMIDGQGDPTNSKEYGVAVESLFAIALAVKLLIKRIDAIEYSVMPLECLWGPDDPSLTHWDRKGDWKWTLMIQQPTPVTSKLYAKGLAEAQAKAPLIIPPTLRFEALKEGRAVQALHLGPLEAFGPVVKAIRDRILSVHAKPVGKYHEIYLSDTRKATPDKWKTIIRQPYL